MTPFFFGSSSRRLFGIYEPAHSGAPSRGAALLCNPWGSEYIYAHRSLRHLARTLCDAGFHTLRFDYFATGDSAGDTAEGGLPGWVTDIETAMEELQVISGTGRVSLIGLRLGATLAAQVAARRSVEVKQLVMWTPIFSGNAANPESASGPARAGGRGENDHYADMAVAEKGFPFTAALRAEFQAVDLEPLLTKPAVRSLLLMPAGQRPPAWTQEHQHAPMQIEVMDPQTPWVEEFSESGALPVSTIQKIIAWLS